MVPISQKQWWELCCSQLLCCSLPFLPAAGDTGAVIAGAARCWLSQNPRRAVLGLCHFISLLQELTPHQAVLIQL